MLSTSALLGLAQVGEEPSILYALLFIAGGLILLTFAGEALVVGASRLALRLRLTPMVIGLTVVAAGTSLPELVVSLIAQLEGSADLAVANVIGSNIFNIAMVLGFCSLVRALPIPPSTARLEYPVLVAVSIGMLWVARGGEGPGGEFARVEGYAMIAALVLFTGVAIHLARRQVTAAEAKAFREEVEEVSGVEGAVPVRLGHAVGQVILGSAGLWLGGEWLISGAIDIAELFEVSERVIGLTLVAGGTGMPELAASIAAVRHGKGEMAVGNVIGSNIFNLLGILGIAAIVKPLATPAAILDYDLYWMIGITVVLLPIVYRSSDSRVRRIEGGILFAGYLVYLASVFLRS